MRRDIVAGGTTLTVGELREAIADLPDGARVSVDCGWGDLEAVHATDLDVVLRVAS